MGLLDGQTHADYYQGNDLGNYQFTNLADIVTSFMLSYVGENKIIPKINTTEVAFHAKRALQELSFDTFKSIKSQQIDLPPTLVMPLPHDYVNYTKISSVDSSGIKHPLYLTNSTSNPFQIKQKENGDYSFPEDAEEVFNGGFSEGKSGFNHWSRTSQALDAGNIVGGFANSAGVSGGGKMEFFHRTRTTHFGSVAGPDWGHVMCAWQGLLVSDKEYVDLSALGQAVNATNGTGVLRVGLSTVQPDSESRNPPSGSTIQSPTTNADIGMFDLFDYQNNPSYIEWTSGDGSVSKTAYSIDVRDYSVIYVIIVSYQEFTGAATDLIALSNVDNVSVINAGGANKNLSSPDGNETESSTWQSYKSITPSENNNDDYEDDTYWPMNGERYGLDPQYAQANGSFYIDQRLGKIHFSSNISGKTVILDYVSDSLGTDSEMMVHKFAEEAMYKYIIHAVMSGSNYGQALVPRLTKEKFAAIRKAKLRLSNIKLEELTQILRGKSKQIKH